MSPLNVQTGLARVDGLSLSGDGSRLAVSQRATGREVWAAPFGAGDRIFKTAEPVWPGATEGWGIPGAMGKFVFGSAGELLEAGVLANIPSLADPRPPLIENPGLEDALLVDFCLSPDGIRLLTAIGTMDGDYCGYVSNWSRSGPSWSTLWTVRSAHFDLRAVAFLQDPTRVLVVEENLGRDPNRDELPKYSAVLTVRDASTGELIAENSNVRHFDDLQQVAVGGAEPVVVLGFPHELHIYKQAELIAKPPVTPLLAGIAAWWWRSPEAAHGARRPWASPQVVQTQWPVLRGLAFHPSGRFLLTVAGESSAAIWDTGTWTLRRQFATQTGNLCSVCTSGDGRLAAVGTDTGMVTIWDWEELTRN